MKIFRNIRLYLLASMLTLFIVQSVASNHYSRAIAIVHDTQSGRGTVYVVAPSGGTSGDESGESSTACKTESSTSSPTHTYSFQVRSTTDGYEFDGWYANETGGTKINDGLTGTTLSVSVTASSTDDKNPTTETRYARWNPKTYTINLDDQDATTPVSPSPLTVQYNNDNFTPITTIPKKSGYAFRGFWTTESESSGRKIIDGSGEVIENVDGYTEDGKWIYTTNDEITLYASWGEKATPGVTCHVNDNTHYVDDANLDLQTLWTREGDGAITYSVLSFEESGENNEDGTTPYIESNRYLHLGKAGTATLKMAVAEGTNHLAKNETIEVVINKRANTLKCAWNNGSAGDDWEEDMNFDSKLPVKFSSTNTSGPAISVTQSPASAVATFKNGAGGANPDTIITNYREGTVTWTVSQAEDYKYIGDEMTCSVIVGTVSSNCDVLNVPDEKEIGDSQYTLTWDDENAAGTLYFQNYCQTNHTGGVNVEQYIKEDGVWQWVTVYQIVYADTKWNDYGNYSTPLNQGAKGVRFSRYGTYRRYFQNVRVSRAKRFDIEDADGNAITEIDMPSKTASGAATTATFYVDYSTCDDEIKVVSDHPRITVSDASFTSTTAGRKAITLTYNSAAAEDMAATVTIYTRYEHKTLTVNAETVAKLATHLEYIGSASYNVDHADIAATSLFRVVDVNGAVLASPAITLTRDEGYADKISIVNNSLHFLCGGDVTITAHYAGDETYAAANDTTVTITVNKLNDVITWNGVGEDGKIHVWADGSIPNTIANGHGGIATYSSNSSLLTVGGSMGSYTLTTGRASGLPQEVTLTATSAGDCQYNPATDSKTVVIEPCTHRIVWNQDFSSLTLDEFGNIYYAADLNAYAVDSLGDSTRVPIRYSIGTNDFASLQNGTKLVVQKRGETTLTATTDASDKYAVVSVTRTVRVVNYGENRARINGEEWKDNRSWTGPHVRFNMEAPNASYDSFYKELDIKANQKNVIKWTLDKGCNITITNIDLGVGYVSSFSATCKLYINGEQKADFWTTTGSDYSFSGYTLGNNDSILLVTNQNIDLYNVNLVYLISPSDAPTRVSSSVEEVYVTIDEGAKQTLDLSSHFSLEDGVPTDFELEYEVVNANGHAFIADGHNFWANAAGDYQVRARVKAAVDHRPSEWSSPKTITVTRLPNTIYVNGEADYSTTMNMRSTLDVAFTATNTNYESAPFVCEATTGSDWMSYSASTASTGQIESGEVLGTTTFHVSQPQDSQYEAAEATFTVELTNSTYEFQGNTDQDWGTTSNWAEENKPTANDNVTVTGNLVIDEEIEVYSLDISGEGTMTIDPTGGLTVGAGGITGATVDNLKLAAGTEGETKGQTGYLRVSPRVATMPQATVELYSVSYYDQAAGADNSAVWQGVGSPISEAGVLAKSVYTSCWVYSWDEATDGWVNNRATLELTPFVGFCTTQKKKPEGRKYTYEGHLVSGAAPVTMDLAYTEGHGTNLLANSWAAPISIPNFVPSDFVNAAQTVYILNAGTKAQSDANEGDFTAPGKYIGVPIQTASELAASGYPVVIPSMQGFFVRDTAAGAQLTLDYSRLVWGADYSGDGSNQPLRAPKHNAEASPVIGKMKVSISAGGWSDFIFLLESEKYMPEYEDGYDAIKIPSGGMDLFTVEGENYLGVDATNSIIGTRVGVRTGEETAYTMTFSHVNSVDEMMLWDIEAEEKVEISEGGMYTFFAEPNSEITGRFIIVEAEAPEIATGVEDVQGDAKVHKFIKDDKLYILKNGVLYDATGMRVR